MTDKVTRHEFLAELHAMMKPKTYFEVGVHRGDSLNLAGPNTLAVGVDPKPLCVPRHAQVIFSMTSREYFRRMEGPNMYLEIDLAFVDGSHLIEDVIFDYENIHRQLARKGVVVFDDVLPYNQEIASRTQPEGDAEWTGDAWKIEPWLQHHYPRMNIALVDTFPTGVLVCWDVGGYKRLRPIFDMPGDQVPDAVLQRTRARSADAVLADLKAYLA